MIFNLMKTFTHILKRLKKQEKSDSAQLFLVCLFIILTARPCFYFVGLAIDLIISLVIDGTILTVKNVVIGLSR